VPTGEAFWYVNSNGLVEIAVNNGRADNALGLSIGCEIAVLT
jgi:S-adenosyl-L-methionine hydrolase (adenosine-forming)